MRDQNILKRQADRAVNLITLNTGMPQGPDLNQYRVPDDFGAVQSVDFVIFKVSQGPWKDGYADYHAEGSHKATDIRGGYFYDDFWHSAAVNVDKYIELAGPMDLDFHAGDWEPYNRNREKAEVLDIDRVLFQLDRLSDAFPGKPILYYMNLDVLQNYLGYDQRLKQYLLWFADPYRRSMPVLKDDFRPYFWQKSWVWPWPGFNNKVWAADSVDWNECSEERPAFRARMLPEIEDPEDPPIDIDFDKIWEHIGTGTQELNAGIKMMEETAVKLTDLQIKIQEGENG